MPLGLPAQSAPLGLVAVTAACLLSAATIHCSGADSNADPNAPGSSLGSGEGGPGGGGADGGAGADGNASAGDGSALAPKGPVCPHPHFCWENPLPQGFDLRSIHGSAPDDLWAVGEAGTLLHGNGSTFSNVVVPGAPSLRAVAVRSKSDAFAVGDGATLLSWNGAVWSKVVAPSSPVGRPFVFTHVASAGSGGEYWVAGHLPSTPLGDFARGVILHIAAGAATTAPLPAGSTPEQFSALSASSPTDVWAINKGNLYRYDGTTWRAGVTTSGLRSLVAVGPTDAWGVAGGGLSDEMVHWDGASWSIAQGGYDFGAGPALSARGPNDVWVVGNELAHYEGKVKGWSKVASPQSSARARGVFAVPSGPTWVVGEGGLIAHDSGTGMKLDTTGVVWTSGSITAPLIPTASFGSSATDLWLVGERAIHFDGTSWKESPALADGTWAGGFARAPNDAWLVARGSGSVLHFDGNAWSSVGSVLPFGGQAMPSGEGIWASGASDVWVADPGGSAGPDGSYNHWNGTGWSKLTQGACAFGFPHAVWGSGPNDVWFGGTQLVHVTGNGGACTAVNIPSGSQQSISSIWGRAANDIWATNGADRFHYDGTTWTQLPFASGPQAADPTRRVSSGGPNDLWALGDRAAFHFDGKTWTAFDGIPSMTSVFAASSKDVWLSGPGGHVLRYVP